MCYDVIHGLCLSIRIKGDYMHNKCLIELKKYGIIPSYCAPIRSKDGVHLYRIECKNQPMVIKIFDTPEQASEIKHYETLKSMHIQTLDLIDATDCSFLMPDLDAHPQYRLATADDLYDKKIIRALGAWYHALHHKSTTICKDTYYSENHLLTKEALHKVIEKTNSQDASVWKDILENLDAIQQLIKMQTQTLTYNDFFWTNLVVHRNGHEAFMFDYNLLGAGFAYSDVRNVLVTLPEETKNIFLTQYGTLSNTEKRIDALTADLVNLVISSNKPVWPSWADESITALYDGSLQSAFERLKPFLR